MEKARQKIFFPLESEMAPRLKGEAEREVFDAEDAAAYEVAFLDVVEGLVPVRGECCVSPGRAGNGAGGGGGAVAVVGHGDALRDHGVD